MNQFFLMTWFGEHNIRGSLLLGLVEDIGESALAAVLPEKNIL
jgi:hypothetical protein